MSTQGLQSLGAGGVPGRGEEYAQVRWDAQSVTGTGNREILCHQEDLMEV